MFDATSPAAVFFGIRAIATDLLHLSTPPFTEPAPLLFLPEMGPNRVKITLGDHGTSRHSLTGGHEASRPGSCVNGQPRGVHLIAGGVGSSLNPATQRNRSAVPRSRSIIIDS